MSAEWYCIHKATVVYCWYKYSVCLGSWLWLFISLIFLLFTGRGRHSHAYTHSVQVDHHVFLNLHTLKVCKNSLMKWVSKLSVASQFIRLVQCTNFCSFGDNTLTVCVPFPRTWQSDEILWPATYDIIYTTWFILLTSVSGLCFQKNDFVGCPKAVKR